MVYIAYTKTTWAEDTARSLANLNNLETQYDEAVDYGIDLRKDSSEEIRAEVLASLPAAGTAGRLVFESTNNILYVDDGANWIPCGGAAVASVQTLNVTMDSTTKNVTITEVDRTRACIILPKVAHIDDARGAIRAKFTTDTNVQLTIADEASSLNIYFQVVEYYTQAVKSLQRGDRDLEDTDTHNITIDEVDKDKCLVFYSYDGDVATQIEISAWLTSDTNFRITKTAGATGDNKYTVSYEIIEFY